MAQNELGKRVGVSRGAINQLCAKQQKEGGGRNISRMADVLNVPLEWLAFNRGPGPQGTPYVPPKQDAGPPADASTDVQKFFPMVTGSLQRATLETLANLMAQGKFSDAECIELLQELKPRLGA